LGQVARQGVKSSPWKDPLPAAGDPIRIEPAVG
jgi:hypothetical protein